jgi:hypothetical protein
VTYTQSQPQGHSSKPTTHEHGERTLILHLQVQPLQSRAKLIRVTSSSERVSSTGAGTGTGTHARGRRRRRRGRSSASGTDEVACSVREEAGATRRQRRRLVAVLSGGRCGCVRQTLGARQQ